VFASDFTPVLIIRGAENLFYALDSECKHAGCVVEPYNPSTGRIRCSCHGSAYLIDGTLAQGPATEGLDRFDVRYDGADEVQVSIPGIGLAVSQIATQSLTGNTRRLRLVFTMLKSATYAIRYQSSLLAAPQTVAFALTPTGPTTQTSRYIPSTGGGFFSTETVYVDSTDTTGFFTVATQLETFE
jgi:nitrite reductase/ring-hydroxylating ferredoxin subunit